QRDRMLCFLREILFPVTGQSTVEEHISSGVYRKVVVEQIPVGTVHRRFISKPGEIFLPRGISVVGLRTAEKLSAGYGNRFLQVRPDGLLHKDIIVKTGVSVEDGHKSRDLRPVGHMVGRIPGSGKFIAAVVSTFSHKGEGA